LGLEIFSQSAQITHRKKEKRSSPIDERAKTRKPFLAEFDKSTKQTIKKAWKKRDYLKRK